MLIRLSERFAPIEGMASHLEARPGLDGHFVLKLPPGTYQAEVWVGGLLAHSEWLTLTPGSHWKEFRVAIPEQPVAALSRPHSTGR